MKKKTGACGVGIGNAVQVLCLAMHYRKVKSLKTRDLNSALVKRYGITRAQAWYLVRLAIEFNFIQRAPWNRRRLTVI